MGLFDSLFGSSDTAAKDTLMQGEGIYIDSANSAIDMLRGANTTAQAGLQPYYNAGTSGLNAYAGLLGIPGAPQTYNPMQYLQNVPGYQWGQQQGMNALNASTNASGMYGSGPQREAAIQYGQNYGTNYYNTLMNQLAGLGNMGQQAGTQMGNWGMSSAAQQAPIEMSIGRSMQNTMGTMAGMDLQQQQMQGAGLGNLLGMGLGAITAPLTGGTSLLGMGLGALGGGLGSLLGAGSSGMGGANMSQNYQSMYGSNPFWGS